MILVMAGLIWIENEAAKEVTNLRKHVSLVRTLLIYVYQETARKEVETRATIAAWLAATDKNETDKARRIAALTTLVDSPAIGLLLSEFGLTAAVLIHLGIDGFALQIAEWKGDVPD